MNKLTCIAIDDEPLAHQIIVDYSAKVGFLDLVKSFTNPLEALTFLQTHLVDIVFIDIQMAEITGLNLVSLLPTSCKIIFTTAYKEYAVEAYNLNAIDYLLKPFSFERFLQAILKVSVESSKPKITQAHDEQEEKHTTLYVKTDKKIVALATQNLFYIQGLKDYVILMSTNGKLIARESIKHLEEMLGEEKFMRIHKSYIISLQHIDFIEGNFLQISGSKIPIGSSYKQALLLKLNDKIIGKR